MAFAKTTPILRIFDERKAKEFYIAFLGFRIDWEHRFDDALPLYMQISMSGCVLHLSEHHGDCCPGSAVRIETDQLEEFHRQLSGKCYPYAKPDIQHMPWGSRDLTVVDPFGNRLTFTDAVSTRESEN
ncbi:bleomycin resistance protein [Nitrospira sp. KM1]|uniref:glyoxalase superfamily protein n=1 Tax=Nitrospira sp. KM1 TaxID=1936990 RepID=UPI0013A76057|nr:glyoxalase superfamily protein [Nitrospira sp. KM1]BCA56285.1 bleomycin resistance protein [Nitrospira sp. KM1]